MTRTFALSLLQDRRELLDKILSFNGLEGQPDPPEVLSGKPLWDQIRSAHLVKRRLKGRTGRFDFENPFNRLILLPQLVRESLVLYLGACLWAPEISRLVTRAEAGAVRRALGRERYAFATGRAEMLLSVQNRMKLRGGEREFGVEKLSLSGTQCLWHLTQQADEKYRLELAMPPGGDSIAQEMTPALWRLTERILINEIDASWQNIIS